MPEIDTELEDQQQTTAPPVDYDALARKFGAIDAAPAAQPAAAPPIDYDELAKRFGAVPAETPRYPALPSGLKKEDWHPGDELPEDEDEDFKTGGAFWDTPAQNNLAKRYNKELYAAKGQKPYQPPEQPISVGAGLSQEELARRLRPAWAPPLPPVQQTAVPVQAPKPSPFASQPVIGPPALQPNPTPATQSPLGAQLGGIMQGGALPPAGVPVRPPNAAQVAFQKEGQAIGGPITKEPQPTPSLWLPEFDAIKNVLKTSPIPAIPINPEDASISIPIPGFGTVNARTAKTVANTITGQVTAENAAVILASEFGAAGLKMIANAPEAAQFLRAFPALSKAVDIGSRTAVPAAFAATQVAHGANAAKDAYDLAAQGKTDQAQDALVAAFTNLAMGALSATGAIGQYKAGEALYPPAASGEGITSLSGRVITPEEVGAIPKPANSEQAAAVAKNLAAGGNRLAAEAWQSLDFNNPVEVQISGEPHYISAPQRVPGRISGRPAVYQSVTDGQGNVVYGGTPSGLRDWLISKQADVPLHAGEVPLRPQDLQPAVQGIVQHINSGVPLEAIPPTLAADLAAGEGEAPPAEAEKPPAPAPTPATPAPKSEESAAPANSDPFLRKIGDVIEVSPPSFEEMYGRPAPWYSGPVKELRKDPMTGDMVPIIVGPGGRDMVGTPGYWRPATAKQEEPAQSQEETPEQQVISETPAEKEKRERLQKFYDLGRAMGAGEVSIQDGMDLVKNKFAKEWDSLSTSQQKGWDELSTRLTGQHLPQSSDIQATGAPETAAIESHEAEHLTPAQALEQWGSLKVGQVIDSPQGPLTIIRADNQKQAMAPRITVKDANGVDTVPHKTHLQYWADQAAAPKEEPPPAAGQLGSPKVYAQGQDVKSFVNGLQKGDLIKFPGGMRKVEELHQLKIQSLRPGSAPQYETVGVSLRDQHGSIREYSTSQMGPLLKGEERKPVTPQIVPEKKPETPAAPAAAVTDNSVRDFPVRAVYKDGKVTVTLKIGRKPMGTLTFTPEEWAHPPGGTIGNPEYDRRQLVRQKMVDAQLADFEADGADQAGRIADAVRNAVRKVMPATVAPQPSESTAPSGTLVLSPREWAGTFGVGERISYTWNGKPTVGTVARKRGDMLVVASGGDVHELIGTPARQENVKRLAAEEKSPEPAQPEQKQPEPAAPSTAETEQPAAPETPATPLDLKISSAKTLADSIANELRNSKLTGGAFAIGNNVAFQKLADLAFGGSRASGKYEMKEAYDALEAAINSHIAEMIGPDLLTTDPEVFPAATARTHGKDAHAEHSQRAAGTPSAVLDTADAGVLCGQDGEHPSFGHLS